MLIFLFCMNKNYSLCTTFRVANRKNVCYYKYNKEEIKQQRKNLKRKSEIKFQIICDRSEKDIKNLKFQKEKSKSSKIKSLQDSKEEIRF